jgi:uncharacterized OB-fold protein
MTRADGGVVFTAPHVVEYAYRRSVGQVLGRFFTGLRERRLIGTRTRAGRVLVPPCEYDPDTGESVTEFVDVGPGGAVTSWAWVKAPSAKHPLPRPFAWALIRLDGADTAMLHAVDAGSEARMRAGLRVRPRWREKTLGEIQDIECFEPEAAK